MLYKKDNIIRDSSRIVIIKDNYQIINPTKEMILADGWVDYVPELVTPVYTFSEQLEDMILDQYNQREDITNNEALKRPLLIYNFNHYVGKSLKTGQIISYEDNLYRVKQDINTVLANHYPSIDTAALYEIIDIVHEGTLDDPIPYNGNMILEEGKYYIENEQTYLCNRSTITAVYHPLSSLVGIYVEVIS